MPNSSVSHCSLEGMLDIILWYIYAVTSCFNSSAKPLVSYKIFYLFIKCETSDDVERYIQIRELTAEIFSKYTNLTCEKILDLFSSEKGYATPKIDVRGAIFQDNKILLVKERKEGLWALPG